MSNAKCELRDERNMRLYLTKYILNVYISILGYISFHLLNILWTIFHIFTLLKMNAAYILQRYINGAIQRKLSVKMCLLTYKTLRDRSQNGKWKYIRKVENGFVMSFYGICLGIVTSWNTEQNAKMCFFFFFWNAEQKMTFI